MTETRTPDMIYLDLVITAIDTGMITLEDLPHICPECDDRPIRSRWPHTMIKDRVVIGCEGFHILKEITDAMTE